MQNISLTPRREWEEYNLQTKNVFVDGEATKFQAIFYKGKFVNFMTKIYEVLPNEDVIKVASEFAEKAGAKTYIPNSANYGWFRAYGNESHVISNPIETEIRANFVFDKVDITGKGDYVQPGFSFGNSIGGTKPFSIAPMTVRNVCDNQMYHLANETSLVSEMLEKTEILKDQHERIKEARDEFKAITAIKKRHSSQLDLDFVRDAIDMIRKKAEVVIQRYREMYELKLLQKQAELLARNMPKAIVKETNFLNIAKDGKVSVSGEITQWEAFNHFTQSLTFAKKRNFGATFEAYRKLDRILVSV